MEQPLRMYNSARPLTTGTSVCIINCEQFISALRINQLLLLRARQPFDRCFALHGLSLGGKQFAVHQSNRAAPAGIFCPPAAVVRSKAGGQVVGPAAVERAVRAADDIGVAAH